MRLTLNNLDWRGQVQTKQLTLLDTVCLTALNPRPLCASAAVSLVHALMPPRTPDLRRACPCASRSRGSGWRRQASGLTQLRACSAGSGSGGEAGPRGPQLELARHWSLQPSELSPRPPPAPRRLGEERRGGEGARAPAWYAVPDNPSQPGAGRALVYHTTPSFRNCPHCTPRASLDTRFP